jgi:small subunit ribosomal protein S20
MPQTKAAKKALRVSLRRRAENLVWKRKAKDLRRKIKKALAGKDKAVFELVSQYFQVLDKSVKKNIIHKNTAARYKSKVLKKVNEIFGKDFQLPRVKEKKTEKTSLKATSSKSKAKK